MAASGAQQIADGGQDSIPGLSKLGVVTIAFGLLYDLVEHGMGPTATAGGFSTGEHTAHFIALLGMVLVLAGVVVQGVKRARQAEHVESRPGPVGVEPPAPGT